MGWKTNIYIWNAKINAFHFLFWTANNIYLTILNSDPVRKNDEKSSKSQFGENTVQFVLYLDGIIDENCFINEKGVIEYHDPHCKNCFSNDLIKKSFNKRKIFL